DYSQARSLLEASLAIGRELGDKRFVADAESDLGRVALTEGDYDTAFALLKEGLRLRQDMGDRRGIALSIERLAFLRAAQGEWESAARLFGASEGCREALSF